MVNDLTNQKTEALQFRIRRHEMSTRYLINFQTLVSSSLMDVNSSSWPWIPILIRQGIILKDSSSRKLKSPLGTSWTIKTETTALSTFTYYNNLSTLTDLESKFISTSLLFHWMHWTLLVITQNNCSHTYLVTSNGELLIV